MNNNCSMEILEAFSWMNISYGLVENDWFSANRKSSATDIGDDFEKGNNSNGKLFDMEFLSLRSSRIPSSLRRNRWVKFFPFVVRSAPRGRQLITLAPAEWCIFNVTGSAGTEKKWNKKRHKKAINQFKIRTGYTIGLRKCADKKSFLINDRQNYSIGLCSPVRISSADNRSRHSNEWQ